MGNWNSTTHRTIEEAHVAFWIGSQSKSILPSCWDELIDWTEDASKMLQMYSMNRRQRLRQTSSHEEHDNNSSSSSSNSDKDDPLHHGGESNDILGRHNATNEHCNHSGTTIKLIPLVARDQRNKIHEIPSMTYFDRAKFFGENILVVVVHSSPSTASEHPRHKRKHLPMHGTVLPVGRFVEVYTLLLRYTDLLALIQESSNGEEKDSDYNFSVTKNPPTNTTMYGEVETEVTKCIICLNDYGSTKEMVVLSCSHTLCRTCSKKWVSRRLNCPFCRHTFTKRNVVKSQWQVIEEWQSLLDNEIVDRDIQRMEQKVTKFWKCNKTTMTCTTMTSNQEKQEANLTHLDLSESIQENLLHTVPGYVSEGRTIPTLREVDDVIILE